MVPSEIITGTLIVSAFQVLMSRTLAVSNGAVLPPERIASAKANFASKVPAACLLIDALEAVENLHQVVGHLQFTIKTDGGTLEIHYGNSQCTTTAIGSLVALSEHSEFNRLTVEELAVFQEVFSEGVSLLARDITDDQ